MGAELLHINECADGSVVMETKISSHDVLLEWVSLVTGWLVVLTSGRIDGGDNGGMAECGNFYSF